MLEGTKDQATVPEAKEHAKEPLAEQKTEQQEPIPETEPQGVEDTSTTQLAPEEVAIPD